MSLEIIRQDRTAKYMQKLKAASMMAYLVSDNTRANHPEAFTTTWMQDKGAKHIELTRDMATRSTRPAVIRDFRDGVETQVHEKFSGIALKPRNIDGELVTVRRTTPNPTDRFDLVAVLEDELDDIAHSDRIYASFEQANGAALQIPGIEVPTFKHVSVIIETLGRLAEMHSVPMKI